MHHAVRWTGLPLPSGPMCAGREVLPAADGQACSGGYVRVCVWSGSGSGLSQSPSVLSVTAQRAGASSRAPGGCPGAAVSVVCALRGSLSCVSL